MLVLTRKVAEKLYIGQEICVTVVRLDGGQVRLGIEAPREVAVVRAELLLRDAVGAPGPAREAESAAVERPAPVAVRGPRRMPLEIDSRRRVPSR